MGIQQRRESLVALLEDESPAVVDAASKALEALDAAASLEHLLEMTKSTDPSHVVSAIYGLVRIRTTAAFDAVMQLAKHPREDVRASALRVMVERSDPAFLRAIVTGLDDASLLVREQAVIGIGRLRERRAVPKLIAMLKGTSDETRVGIINVLGQLGDARAESILLLGLKAKNAKLRVAAAVALMSLDLDEAPAPT